MCAISEFTYLFLFTISIPACCVSIDSDNPLFPRFPFAMEGAHLNIVPPLCTFLLLTCVDFEGQRGECGSVNLHCARGLGYA